MSSLILCDGNCDMCQIRNNCPLSLEFKKKLAEEYFTRTNSIEPESPPLTNTDVMFEMQGSLFNFIQGWDIIHSTGEKIDKKRITMSMMNLFPYKLSDVHYDMREQFSKIIKAIAGKIFLIVTGDCKASKEECYHCCLKEYCSQITRARSGKATMT